jgi:CheY-like chemotaxis protein
MTARKDSTAPMKKRRVLIVEDETLIAMLLEDMLGALGHEVGVVVGRIDEAVKSAREPGFDFAILDVNLNGSDVYEVAEILAERKIPFVFATGYGERGMPPQFRGRPLLQKPFQLRDLELVLTEALKA